MLSEEEVNIKYSLWFDVTQALNPVYLQNLRCKNEVNAVYKDITDRYNNASAALKIVVFDMWTKL